jgi:hypothetical protein
MTNPWLELRSEPPYVLEMDSGQIRQHDSQRHASGKLGLDSIPEPFIGNPETASSPWCNGPDFGMAVFVA